MPLTAQELDRAIAAEWRRRGIVPAQPVDDAGFIRRAYLDLTGVIPPPEAVVAFVADPAPNRRQRLIDQLLRQDRYAEHFTNYWEGVLFPRGRKRRSGDIDRHAFRAWFRERLAAGLGWDRLVYELLTAEGINSVGGPRDPATGAAMGADTPAPGAVNGAVNFLLPFERNPQDLGGVVARELLGVQIQCAQCHDHPTERWKQEHFRRFVAALARLRVRRIDTGPVRGVRRIEVSDGPKPIAAGPDEPELRAIAQAKPMALDGTDLSGPNPRQALAAWITSPQNPWFARVLVNRYWAYLIGRGFCEPVDDLRPSNPVTMPSLLDRLARDFAAHGFDLRRLIRLITATRVYQLSAGPCRDPDPEHRLWPRYRLRPLGPNELLDSIVAATGFDQALQQATARGDELERVRQRLRESFSFLFEVDEEVAPPGYLGTVQQALYLLNGSLVHHATRAAPGSALVTVLQGPGDDQARIRALYLRTLSRPPDPTELASWLAFLSAPRELVHEPPPGRHRPPQGPDPLRSVAARLRPPPPTPRQQAFEDMMWVLINSSEFVFRH